MIPDEAAVKAALEWMDRRDKGYAYSRGGEKHGQVLAAALREAQDERDDFREGARVESVEGDRVRIRAEDAESKLATMSEACLAAEKQKDDLINQLGSAKSKALSQSARADGLNVQLLASSLESRELREAILATDKCHLGHFKFQSCGCRLQSLHAIQLSSNAERAEKVLRVVEAAKEYERLNRGRPRWETPEPDLGKKIRAQWKILVGALAELDSRSEGV